MTLFISSGKRIFWKPIFLSLLFLQLLSSCERDHVNPVGVSEEPKKELKNFKDHIFSTQKLAFPNVVEGREQPDGSHNKTSSIGWTHPSVLYFEKKWNNHKYWMAITPYPDGVNEYENPTIFCSDNGIKWEEPKGISNPIEKTPKGVGYNSDVNLLFENGRMYCFWRAMSVIHPITGEIVDGRALLYTSSIDGVHWSPKKLVTSWPYVGVDLIAPSILKEADNYYCYGVCSGEPTTGTYFTNNAIRRVVVQNVDDIRINRSTGYDLINIQNRPWGSAEDPWHLEARKFQGKWYLLVSTTIVNEHGRSGRLFLGESNDGINFTFGTQPLCPVTYAYKSSFELYKTDKPGVIAIKLWRTSSLPWSVYYDEFSLEGYFH